MCMHPFLGVLLVPFEFVESASSSLLLLLVFIYFSKSIATGLLGHAHRCSCGRQKVD